MKKKNLFLLRYTDNLIIYKFTQGNLGAKKLPEADFRVTSQEKYRKLRHW